MARGNGAAAAVSTLTKHKKQTVSQPRFQLRKQKTVGGTPHTVVIDTVHNTVVEDDRWDGGGLAERLNEQLLLGATVVRLQGRGLGDFYTNGLYCLVCGASVKTRNNWAKTKPIPDSDYQQLRCSHMPTGFRRYSARENAIFDQQLLAALGRSYLAKKQHNEHSGAHHGDPDRFEVGRIAAGLYAPRARVVGRLEALERQGLITEGGWKDFLTERAVRRLTPAGVDAAVAAAQAFTSGV